VPASPHRTSEQRVSAIKSTAAFDFSSPLECRYILPPILPGLVLPTTSFKMPNKPRIG